MSKWVYRDRQGMAPPFRVLYFTTERGSCPPRTFLDGLPAKDAAYILADIQAFCIHGVRAPISTRSIRDHAGLWEIRTGGFRTFYGVMRDTVWIRHICGKADQDRGIDLAAKRLKEIKEE
jgi:hypothetical protein